MHPDGYIELRDRAKDIIISGGENISTIEVEQAIAKHPAVLEVAVVAIPHEKWGEVAKAFITLRPGASASEGEIIEFSREHLANFKALKQSLLANCPKPQLVKSRSSSCVNRNGSATKSASTNLSTSLEKKRRCGMQRLFLITGSYYQPLRFSHLVKNDWLDRRVLRQ